MSPYDFAELEALKKVADMVTQHLPLSDEEFAALQQVLGLIDRVESLTTSSDGPVEAAKAVLGDHGFAIIDMIDAGDVREALEEGGLDELAADLSDLDIMDQVKHVLNKWALPSGLSDWKADIASKVAFTIADTAGLKMVSE